VTLLTVIRSCRPLGASQPRCPGILPRCYPHKARFLYAFGNQGAEANLRLVFRAAMLYSSTVQTTKHPPLSFKIFVAESGTRRVEPAST
jgi:hypothetical protein